MTCLLVYVINRGEGKVSAQQLARLVEKVQVDLDQPGNAWPIVDDLSDGVVEPAQVRPPLRRTAT